MSGGLFDPLGTDRAEAPARAPAATVMLALALGALAALVALSWFRDDGDRGRPVATAPIDRVEAPPRPAPAPSAPAVAPSAAGAPPSGLPPAAADQEVEIQNGVRIIRPRRTFPAGVQAVPAPPAAPAR